MCAVVVRSATHMYRPPKHRLNPCTSLARDVTAPWAKVFYKVYEEINQRRGHPHPATVDDEARFELIGPCGVRFSIQSDLDDFQVYVLEDDDWIQISGGDTRQHRAVQGTCPNVARAPLLA